MNYQRYSGVNIELIINKSSKMIFSHMFFLFQSENLENTFYEMFFSFFFI